MQACRQAEEDVQAALQPAKPSKDIPEVLPARPRAQPHSVDCVSDDDYDASGAAVCLATPYAAAMYTLYALCLPPARVCRRTCVARRWLTRGIAPSTPCTRCAKAGSRRHRPRPTLIALLCARTRACCCTQMHMYPLPGLFERGHARLRILAQEHIAPKPHTHVDARAHPCGAARPALGSNPCASLSDCLPLMPSRPIPLPPPPALPCRADPVCRVPGLQRAAAAAVAPRAQDLPGGQQAGGGVRLRPAGALAVPYSSAVLQYCYLGGGLATGQASSRVGPRPAVTWFAVIVPYCGVVVPHVLVWQGGGKRQRCGRLAPQCSGRRMVGGRWCEGTCSAHSHPRPLPPPSRPNPHLRPAASRSRSGTSPWPTRCCTRSARRRSAASCSWPPWPG